MGQCLGSVGFHGYMECGFRLKKAATPIGLCVTVYRCGELTCTWLPFSLSFTVNCIMETALYI